MQLLDNHLHDNILRKETPYHLDKYKGVQLTLVKDLISKKSRTSTFSDEVMEFSQTLNFYSPKAYEFIPAISQLNTCGALPRIDPSFLPPLLLISSPRCLLLHHRAFWILFNPLSKGLSESEIQAFWSCKIEGESRVPHITEGDVKPGKLVPLRGMIQDSLETELYPRGLSISRFVYDGETNWVQQSSKTILDSIPSSSTQNQRFKRPLDSDEDTLNDVPHGEQPITTTEKQKSQIKLTSVIAKIYGDASPDLVLNEPIDLFGIIAMSEEEDIQSSDENIQVRVPPPSIVPRIHVLLYKKVNSHQSSITTISQISHL
ncbi:unnamed protein product [Lepeophtheirus salmonis]|uniref:Mini-chromosome maintenance complex-binding protein n=1 Tax=Lepeophtheirus salmonis TaxID=72036 RepID=A0A817FAU2_LEPSM|nr:unnamed protein product [Lepeophtheirus salmonis]CAG9475424.1 unnamed protein product [Lepeophtheirus salmonis]